MSSLVYLGFSIIMFVVSFGILFTIMPMILGQFYTTMNNMPIQDPSWQAMSDETQTTIQYIVPLTASLGIFVFVLKVLMVASVRGRD